MFMFATNVGEWSKKDEWAKTQAHKLRRLAAYVRRNTLKNGPTAKYHAGRTVQPLHR